MHKKMLIAATTVLAAAATISASDLNNNGNRGLLRTTSAQTLGAANLNIGLGIKYSEDQDFARGTNGRFVVRVSDSLQLNPDYTNRLVSTNLYAAIGAGKHTDISLSLPLHYETAQWGVEKYGLGDFELAVKVNPFKQDKLFACAFGLKTILPTGVLDKGYFARHAYSYDKSISNGAHYSFTGGTLLVEPGIFVTGNFNRVKIHANLGDVITIADTSSTITSAAGIEFLINDHFNVFSEVSGETRARWFTDDFKLSNFDNDMAYVSAGTRYQFKNGIYLLAAVDRGISEKTYSLGSNENYIYEQKKTPIWGGNVQIGWNGKLKAKDSDLDGIPNKMDICPKAAEDKDGFNDEDGCPDFDNDNDGIVDSLETCPNAAEDKDGYQDADGCPDFDNDSDNIVDSLDKCPNAAEDKDGFNDEDGCPDFDNDNDGIVDSLDKCLGVAEDKDGYQDEDGCPDQDNDGDNIADIDDKCPNAKGLATDDGCPVVVEISREGLVLNGVTFEIGKELLTDSSSKTLDAVAASLISWPEVKIEIQGHTDSTGSVEKNQIISQGRADAVKHYLYNKGVSENRMSAKGYGKLVPVADKKTVEGRAQNRRVELKRID